MGTFALTDTNRFKSSTCSRLADVSLGKTMLVSTPSTCIHWRSGKFIFLRSNAVLRVSFSVVRDYPLIMFMCTSSYAKTCLSGLAGELDSVLLKVSPFFFSSRQPLNFKSVLLSSEITKRIVIDWLPIDWLVSCYHLSAVLSTFWECDQKKIIL